MLALTCIALKNRQVKTPVFGFLPDTGQFHTPPPSHSQSTGTTQSGSPGKTSTVLYLPPTGMQMDVCTTHTAPKILHVTSLAPPLIWPSVKHEDSPSGKRKGLLF